MISCVEEERERGWMGSILLYIPDAQFNFWEVKKHRLLAAWDAGMRERERLGSREGVEGRRRESSSLALFAFETRDARERNGTTRERECRDGG